MSESSQNAARRRSRERVALAALALAIAAGTFLLDLETPLGVGASVPYTLLVLLSLRSVREAPTWIAALAATALTVLGLVIDLQTPGVEPWKGYVNRSTAVFTFWSMAALGVAYKRSRNRLQLEQTLLLRTEQLASLGEMAAGISHELGTPLGALQGRLEILEQKLATGEADPDELRKTVGIATALCERMAAIIRAVRNLARDASSDPFVDVPVARIVHDALALAGERLRKLGIELRVEPIDPALHTACREAQIAQVVLNLVANAADAVAERDERWIRIAAERRGDRVEIAVTDNGPGIPIGIRAGLMQPFFTTKPAGQGTGLGLSISRALVEAHAGTLALDTDSPHTRFVVTLPVRS